MSETTAAKLGEIEGRKYHRWETHMFGDGHPGVIEMDATDDIDFLLALLRSRDEEAGKLRAERDDIDQERGEFERAYEKAEQDAGKLREALREIVTFLDGYGDDDPAYVMSNVRRIARAALSAGEESA